MSQQDAAPMGAIAHDPSPFAAALRALALGGLVAALAACAEQGAPTAPQRSPAASADLTASSRSAAPAELTADAIDRLLPALEKDAAGPVGNALRALDAQLRDPNATAVAAARAAATVQNVLAQFTDPARPDAADLDAMRLEADDIRASLR